MDNRFRREQNLSRPSSKKMDHTQKEVKSDSDVPNKADSGFTAYFADAYKKATKHHVVRDTTLLTIVLFCALFAISFVLPRVFSFHFDTSSILNIFQQSSVPGQSEEEAGDMNILILGRGGVGNSAPDLTDSIILGHYNKEKNSFVTLSVPRDLLVQSEKLGRVKINEIYSSTKKTF